eukprot:COSAG05_NODE_3091_length_2331_cov_1.383513_5_plen_55_part_00
MVEGIVYRDITMRHILSEAVQMTLVRAPTCRTTTSVLISPSDLYKKVRVSYDVV